MILAARKETGVPVEELRLQGSSREWTVEMLRGEPDSFIANLDGGGLRLSGEENPEPVGASHGLAAARGEPPEGARRGGARRATTLIDIDVRPDRVSVQLEVRRAASSSSATATTPSSPAATSSPWATTCASIKLSQIDPKAIERIAKSRKVKDLGNIQYVLLRPQSVFTSKLGLATYLAKDMDPTYVSSDLHGRHITWPEAVGSHGRRQGTVGRGR